MGGRLPRAMWRALVLAVPVLALGTACILFREIEDYPRPSLESDAADTWPNETEPPDANDGSIDAVDGGDATEVADMWEAPDSDSAADDLGETSVDSLVSDAPDASDGDDSADMSVPADTADTSTSDAGDSAPSCPAGMVLITGGTYTPGGVPDAGLTTVPAFCMDLTEVTTAAFAACVTVGDCVSPATDTGCNYGVSGRELHPVNCVNHFRSKTYCEKKGRRLPSEAEWEWVARAGYASASYPWAGPAPSSTDSPERLCWSGKATRGSTCPVGTFPTGDGLKGLQDIAGSVAEWTADLPFVIRGGSWQSTLASEVEAKGRVILPAFPDYLPTVGFRCAKTP